MTTEVPVPKPTIYLRNHFVIKPNAIPQFLYGKENLIRNTVPCWHLMAACAERPVWKNTQDAEPSLSALQVWRLDDWNTLYKTIYRFSDSGWYNALGSTLASEHQDLLVGVLGGDTVPRAPHWADDNIAGYCYLYEAALPHHGRTQQYLRGLNWFTALARKAMQWQRVWTGLQVTAAPSEIAVLWKVPGNTGAIEDGLRAIITPGATAERYQVMMGSLKTLSRKALYPMFSERIAQLVHENPRRSIPQIIPRPDPLFAPSTILPCPIPSMY
jgi:hypothetical protein